MGRCPELFRLHESPTDEKYPFKLKRKEWILKWANKQNGLGIELGCGHSKTSGDILATDIVKKGGITNAVEGLTSEADIVIDATTFSSLFEDETFDFIISSHMIEHIEHDVKMLQCWLKKLKKDGILIIMTPDARYWDHSPDHVREYTPKQLRDLFSKFNVTILELDTADWHKTELNIVVRKK